MIIMNILDNKIYDRLNMAATTPILGMIPSAIICAMSYLQIALNAALALLTAVASAICLGKVQSLNELLRKSFGLVLEGVLVQAVHIGNIAGLALVNTAGLFNSYAR